jgi:flavin reductase (DIM6/NTAB) family NADH-FMN oxidoreductase RutF
MKYSEKMHSSLDPRGTFKSFEASNLSQGAIYKLMIGAIVPRPIAFVSTISAEGVGNLAPFSFFNGVSSNPPCLVFSVTRKRDGGKKDTLRNIEETGGFVINTVSEWMVEPMHQTSADYPFGVDEMIKVGLTPLPSLKVKAPRVQEAAVQMECELYQTVDIGGSLPGASTLVIGKILVIHAHESVYHEGDIRAEILKPISRLGGAGYGRLGETFELLRPKL